MKLPQLTSCGLWGKKAPPHVQRTMMNLCGEILNLLSSWIRCLQRVNEGINSVLDTLDLLSCVKLTSLRGYRWPTMCNLNPNTWKPSLLLWRNMKPAGCNALFEKKGRIRFALKDLLHLLTQHHVTLIVWNRRKAESLSDETQRNKSPKSFLCFQIIVFFSSSRCKDSQCCWITEHSNPSHILWVQVIYFPRVHRLTGNF